MDKIIEKIIEEISNEEGIQKHKVELSIRNMTDWTREQFINMSHASVLWPHFGSFTVNSNRLKEETKINKIKEFRNNFKKKKDEE